MTKKDTSKDKKEKASSKQQVIIENREKYKPCQRSHVEKDKPNTNTIDTGPKRK